LRLQIEEVIKLVPMVAVFVSIFTLLVSLRKDRNLRTKEYADRVRRSAALVAARADRWRQLSLSLFQDIQVPITEADSMLVEEGDIRRVRDFFWRELFVAQRAIAGKLTGEQIEIAYVDLFGYDSRIHELFSTLVKRLAVIDQVVFKTLLARTQDNIFSEYNENGEYASAQLGNQLRFTAKTISLWCEELMSGILDAFRGEMAKIVGAKDGEITRREIKIRSSFEVFGDLGVIEFSPEAEKKFVNVGKIRKKRERAGEGNELPRARSVDSYDRDPSPPIPPFDPVDTIIKEPDGVES
jgi:hypothetical protein